MQQLCYPAVVISYPILKLNIIIYMTVATGHPNKIRALVCI